MEKLINVNAEENNVKERLEVGQFVMSKYDCQIKKEKILSSGEIYEVLKVEGKKVLVCGDAGKERWVSDWGLVPVNNEQYDDLFSEMLA